MREKVLDEVCRSRGILMNHFIQEALLDRLEELEDVEGPRRRSLLRPR